MSSAVLALLVIGIVMPGAASAAADGPSAHSARNDRLCAKLYPNGKRETEKIRFGTQTTWNWTASAELVCSEAFGVPEGIKLSKAAVCSIAAFGWDLAHPKSSYLADVGCFALSVKEEGVARAALSGLCSVVAKIVKRSRSILGMYVQLAGCIGVVDGVGRSVGVKLEANHQFNVARDILQKRECLRMRNRKIRGIDWSAVSCPRGWGRPAPPKAKPKPAPAVPDAPDAGAPDGGGGPSAGGGDVPAGSYPQTTGGPTNTWTNPANAGGSQGPTIPSGQTVGIACKLQGFKVANGNPWWYRIAQSPWNGNYYASADAFYNNGQTSGSLLGTPWVDPNVPDCSAPPPPPPAPATHQIVVDNRVTNGGTQMREDTPAYLSTVMQNFCKRDGCALPGTDMGSGAAITAECTAIGARTTNGQDNSTIDDGNPGLYTSTRWYGIRWGDGRFGYISEVWIRADFRGGLGLRGC